MPKGTAHELKYLVEIPIPYVDRRGVGSTVEGRCAGGGRWK
jgi:hypothetical protein